MPEASRVFIYAEEQKKPDLNVTPETMCSDIDKDFRQENSQLGHTLVLREAHKQRSASSITHNYRCKNPNMENWEL